MIQLRVVVFFALTIQCVVSQCHPTWWPATGFCYFISNDSLSVDDAEVMCHVLHSKLVEVNNQEKQDLIADLLTLEGVKEAWVGGRTKQYEASFDWRGHRPVTYTSWNRRPPTIPKIERCVYLRWKDGYRWRVHPCTRLHNYVCEKETS